MTEQACSPQSSKEPLTLVVLAAGLGSRYGGLKQIEPVGPGGEAVLDYAVFDARRAGFTRVVFVVRRDIEKDFRSALSHRFERRMDVHYAHQELEDVPSGHAVPPGRRKPWGTGHAALAAAAKTDGPFAVINADDFYGAESYRVLADFLRTSADESLYAMVGFRLDRTLSEHGTVARGVCRTDAQGRLIAVEELTAIGISGGVISNKNPDGSVRVLDGGNPVSLNFWGFRPGVFAHLRRLFAGFLDANRDNPNAEYYLPVAVNALIQEGRAQVQVLSTPSSWFGVTYREDRPVVMESIRAAIRAGDYPERLWG